MAKDPAERPASAAEFATMLTRPLPPPRLEPIAEPVAPAVVAEPVADEEPVTDEEPVADEEPNTADQPSFSRGSVPDQATESRENPPEPTSVDEPEPAPEPAAVAAAEVGPEPEAEPARAAPVAITSGAAAATVDRDQAKPPARGTIVLGVLVAAAALLSFVAIRRYLYEGYGSVLDGPFLADVGAWAPTVGLAIGVVLLWRRTGVGAEWIIGAGTAFVLLNYGGVVDFLRREDNPIDTAAMVMRTIAAALAVVAVVLAWRKAAVPGPRISMVVGAVLIIGAVVAIIGTRDYGDRVDLRLRSWLIIVLIGLLLVRALAFPNRTTGGPALVAGGVVGALAGLESMAREDWDSYTRSSLIMATVGFAVIAVVGVLRWRQSRAPSASPHEPSAA
jgi:hypothetical protein